MTLAARTVYLSEEADFGAFFTTCGLGDGGGVLVLAAEADAGRVGEIQAAARRAGIAVLGGVFPGLLQGDGEVRRGFWMLCFDRMPAHALLETPDEAAIAQAALALVPQDEAVEPVLFVIGDSCLPNLFALLRAVGEALEDRVRYAGANAGSETFQPIACLFDSQRFFSGGMMLLRLPGGVDPKIEHGFAEPVRIFRATKTEGCTILELDGRPAFQVYAEALAEDYGLHVDAQAFYQHAVHYPFGILMNDSPTQIRIPVALGADSGMTCVGEVPENVVILILKAPAIDESDCVRRIAADFPSAASAMLAFYCAGRRMHLGPEQTAAELAALRRQCGGIDLVGALSLGEVSTDGRGAPAFHNAALVCLDLY